MQRTVFCALSLAIGLTMQVNAGAAVDMFLKFDGIDGESTAKGHEKWIEIDSFAFGASHSGIGPSGLGVGKTQLSEVSITQPLDSSSPKEFAALVGNKHIATGILDLVNSGANPQKFFEYTFSDILLSSINFSGSQGDRPTESLTFDYSKIKLQAFSIDDQGQSNPLPPVEFSLNGLAPAPEPSTWALLACGLLMAGMRGRKLLHRRAA